MAGPIRISILADVGRAVRDITRFSDTVDENTRRVITGLGDPKLTGAFGKFQEGFDVLDTRAMGFRDTITGVQDTMSGWQALMGEGEHATDSFGDKLLLLGTGVGDLASGMANFIIPLLAMGQGLTALSLASIRATAATVAQRVATVAGTAATGAMTAAQWLLNVALSANPIGLVIIAIAALVSGIVIAWKRSETFRRVVTGAFEGVQRVVSGVWNWFRSNWPLLLAILTGPIGIAVRFIISNFDRILSTVRSLPGRIRSAVGNLGGLLVRAGVDLISGFVDGIFSRFNFVRSTLNRLTNLLPSWKGPRDRDRKVLRGAGQDVIGGFLDGLESQYSKVEKSLGGFTTDIATSGSVTSSVTATGGGGTPDWARELIRLLRGGLTLTLNSSGGTADDALLEFIRERITVRGGSGQVIGIVQ